MAASACLDGSVRCWSIRTGAPKATLQNATRDAVSCLVDAGGGRLAGGGPSGITVWASASGQQECSAPDAAASPRGPVTALARLWADRLAAGHDSGAVTLWRLGPGDSMTPAGRFDASHSGAVLALAVASARRPGDASGGHPRLLASGGADAMIRLWDPDGGGAGPRALIPLKSNTGPVTGLAAVGGAGTLISASLDGSLRIWSATAMESGSGGFTVACRCLTNLANAAPGGARALCSTTDGGAVVAGTASGALLLWRWDASGRKLAPHPLPAAAARAHAGRGAASAVALASQDGGLVASCDESSGEVRLWLSAPALDGLDGVWAPAPGGAAACAPFVLVREKEALLGLLPNLCFASRGCAVQVAPDLTASPFNISATSSFFSQLGATPIPDGPTDSGADAPPAGFVTPEVCENPTRP